MLLVYGSEFAGGGMMLPILVIAHGLWAVHAILGSVLIAARDGWARSRLVSAAAIVPACALFAGAVYLHGAFGAAVACALAALPLSVRSSVGSFQRRSARSWCGGAWRRIGFASLLMYWQQHPPDR